MNNKTTIRTIAQQIFIPSRLLLILLTLATARMMLILGHYLVAVVRSRAHYRHPKAGSLPQLLV